MAIVITEREFKGSAIVTEIVGNISNSETSITVAASTGWPTGNPGPFAIVLDAGRATEEKILIQSRTGNVLTVATGGRGWDNTSAAAHDNGASAAHCLDAYVLQKLYDFCNDIGNFGARLDAVQTFGYHMTFGDGINVGDLEILNETPVAGTNRYKLTADSGTATHEQIWLMGKGVGGFIHSVPDKGDLTKYFQVNTTGVVGALASAKFGPHADASNTGANIKLSTSGTTVAIVEAESSGTDTDLQYKTKGVGDHKWYAGSTQVGLLTDTGVLTTLSDANFGDGALDGSGTYMLVGSNGETTNAALVAKGSPTDVGLRIITKGAGAVAIDTGGVFIVRNVAGSTNKMLVDTSGYVKSTAGQFGTGAISGSGGYVQLANDTTTGYLQILGSATDYGLYMSGKGTGAINLATGSGKLTVTDLSNGNVGVSINPQAAATAGTGLGLQVVRGDIALDSGILRFVNSQAGSASATAGGAGSLPATIGGYIKIQVDGVTKKIPYYAN
jgi:hypothetical protein